LVNKNQKNKVEKYYDIPDYAESPIKSGDVIGKVRYVIDGKILCESDLYVKVDVNKLKTKDIFFGILRMIVCGKFNKT
jgi:hypothetical protein